MRILICVALVLLAGCAPPRILGSSESAVIVAAGGRPEPEATAVADQHCKRFGRSAKMVGTSAGSAGASPAILYDCVAP